MPHSRSNIAGLLGEGREQKAISEWGHEGEGEADRQKKGTREGAWERLKRTGNEREKSGLVGCFSVPHLADLVVLDDLPEGRLVEMPDC